MAGGLLNRKKVLAAKIEGTAYTAESLTGTNAAMVVFNPVFQQGAEFEQRPSQGSFGHHPGVVSARMGTVTFTVELTGDGSGGVPLWASTFLPACRWVNSAGTFSPKSESPGSNVKTVTIGGYQHGKYKQIHGAMGTAKINMPAGKRITIDFSFTGVWSAPTDVAILAPTYPTVKPFNFENSTWSIGGSWTPKISFMNIDLGNNVVMREDAAASVGYCGAIATDGLVTGQFDPESELVADEDYYGDWLAGTELALSIVLANDDDTITIAAPKIQYTNPQEGDRNGIQIDTLDFQCNKNAAAGDDEFTITFAATE